ncbi:hypothetical protein ACG2LH_07925 [Zhouia sp. PK063]|uniref:hypothetical protein n=1 Tax=Zhouia sp. PK063 TaxID=3373602 RepID=UPI003788CE21
MSKKTLYKILSAIPFILFFLKIFWIDNDQSIAHETRIYINLLLIFIALLSYGVILFLQHSDGARKETNQKVIAIILVVLFVALLIYVVS